MKVRRGAGGILLVAFAISILLLTSIQSIEPAKVQSSEQFDTIITDLKNYAAAVVSAARALPSGERERFIDEALNKYSDEMEARGVSIQPLYSEEDNKVYFSAVRGNDTFYGYVDLTGVVPGTEIGGGEEGGGTGGGGTGGGGSEGGGTGGGGGGEEGGGTGGGGTGGGTICILNSTCPVAFNIDATASGRVSINGEINFIARKNFKIRIFGPFFPKKVKVLKGQEVRILFQNSPGVSELTFWDSYVTLLSFTGVPSVSAIYVDGENVIEGLEPTIIIMKRAPATDVRANVDIAYSVNSGYVSYYVDDGKGRHSADMSVGNYNITIRGMKRGVVKFYGNPSSGGTIRTHGCAEQVILGDEIYPLDGCTSGGTIFHEFLIMGAGRSTFLLSGTIKFVAKDSFVIYFSSKKPCHHFNTFTVNPNQTVEITLGNNKGATIITVKDNYVMLGSAGRPINATRISVDGYELPEAKHILLVAVPKEGSLEASINMSYYIYRGALFMDLDGQVYLRAGRINMHILIDRMNHGTIGMAGNPLRGGALLAKGRAVSVTVEEGVTQLHRPTLIIDSIIIRSDVS